jgi:hypothetical protein
VQKYGVASILIAIAAIAIFVTWPKTSENPAITKASDKDIAAKPLFEAEPPAPEIPVGTSIASMDNIKLLRLLYEPNNSKFNGSASVVYSADFQQDNKRKHIFIANLARAQNKKPLLSAHIFVYTSMGWRCEANYTHLEDIATNFPASKLSWCQIGPNKFALQEQGLADSTNDSLDEYLTLYMRTVSNWHKVLNISQSIEKNEKVVMRLAFERSAKPTYDALVTTTFNQDAPLTVRYLFQGDEYVAAGTVPPMSQEQAMHVRGLPNTDWDGGSMPAR